MARKRRFAAALLAAVLALGLLSGCSTSGAQINRHNARVYVQGVLDETYTGQVREAYLQLTGRDQEVVRAAYEKNREAEYTQRLALRFDLDPTYVERSMKLDFLELLDTLYDHAAYTVKDATPLEDGRYCVEVSVTPVSFFAAAYADGYAQLREEFEKTHTLPQGEAAQAMEPAQLRKATEEYERSWAKEVYDYLYARLDAIPTDAAVTKLALVIPDSQGLYTLSATDLQDIDDLILKY